MSQVEVVHWNPYRRRFHGRMSKHLPIRQRVSNFGDLLGPLLVERILHNAGFDSGVGDGEARRILTVGSIMHLAKTGDVIWGTGVNGKKSPEAHHFHDLDVRAVRGPLTREYLMQRGIKVPEIFGDPALLLPKFYPELEQWRSEPMRDILVVPNPNDWPLTWSRCDIEILNPTSPVMECLEAICRTRFVVGSSLHAIVVAESVGIGARVVRSRSEPLFKYQDYYYGTGRTDFRAASSLGEATSLGAGPPVIADSGALLDAFHLISGRSIEWQVN